MALTFDDDQKALSQTVRRFVAERTPISRVRAVIGSDRAYDEEVWARLAGDLGLAGLIIPAGHGGSGGTLADLAVVLRELGAGLVPSPLLASGVLAAGLLLSCDDEAAKQEWLPRIADGSVVGAVAGGEPCLPGVPGGDAWLPARPVTRADPGGASLTGTKTAVINGAEADLMLVAASDDTEAGIAIYLVRRGAAGLSVRRDHGIDPTRSTATVVLDSTPAIRLAGDAHEALERLADLANVALAAEQLGAMSACVAMTAEYAKVRYSFGQPIGAYQGVKHKLADMYTDWALADAALRQATEAAGAADAADAAAAAGAAGERADGFPAAAAAARALTSPAYVSAARNTMLLHGGVGFTWEHDAHLYYKNALASSVLLGKPEYQLTRLADQLGI